MDAREAHKRKRHQAACWECHRRHRACDGERPCGRCVAKGKEATCQTLQRKKYTRTRKPERGQRLNEQLLSLSIFHQTTNSHSPISKAAEKVPNEGQNQNQLLAKLLHKVKEVQEMTESLQMQQQTLTKQLITLRSPTSPTNEIQLYPFSPCSELLDAQSSDMSSPNTSPPSFDSSLEFLDVGLELFPSISTQQELFDLWELSHDSEQNLPTTIPNDAKTFKESLFIPFAITDASQPFYFFRVSIVNWDLWNNYPHKETDCMCKRDPRVSSWTILSANLSMCKLSQYQLEELVGESIFKLLPPHHKHITHPPQDTFNRFLLPQPPHVHVSDVLTKKKELMTKDGTVLTGMSNIQLFYNEGLVSFGVSSMIPGHWRLPSSSPLPSSSSVQSPYTPSSSSFSTPLSDDSDNSCWISPGQEEEVPRFSENEWMLGD